MILSMGQLKITGCYVYQKNKIPKDIATILPVIKEVDVSACSIALDLRSYSGFKNILSFGNGLNI